jgi:SPX domain protein involved in polyphosphate accumulation
MSRDLLTPRYELKMVYDETLLEELRSWVNVHPSAFNTAYPPRWVNSLYMDTLDLDTFNDHLAGVPVRRKLRFRWYGENLQYARGFMEIKNKSERVGWKIIQPVDREFDLATMDWVEIMDGLRSGTTDIVSELVHVSRPVVLTVYLREYYVSADRPIRLTIDSELHAYEQLFTVKPNLWFRQFVEPKIVVELKSDVSNAGELSDILAHFPIRANRYSKYMENLSPALVA